MFSMFSELKIKMLQCEHAVVERQWTMTQGYVAPESRLYLALKGKGMLIYEGTEFVLTPGKAYLFPARGMLHLLPSKGFGHYWLHFTTQVLPGVGLFGFFDYIHEVDADERCCELFRNIYSNIKSDKPALSLQVMAWFCELASFFMKDKGKAFSGFSDMERFTESLNYIERNLSGDISMKDLASTVHLHPNYFSTKFRSLFKVSPQEYILRKRMEKSQIMLEYTDLPLSVIAGECGFNDAGYFSRMFLKKVGIAPSRYRKIQKLRSGGE